MKRYEHVILIGIDGGGAFFRQADTPNFDRIFADGAVTYEGYASRPSISAECWASMLIGVSPKIHGLTNEIISQNLYPLKNVFPTVYKRIREAMPEAKLAAYCDWQPIITGIVESDTKTETLSMRDCELIPHIESCIRSTKPDFLFVHMDSCDHAGHENGYGTPAHLEQIHTVDGYIGSIYAACRDADILETTLFCVVCDHGGTCDPDGKGGFTGAHGGWTENEKKITFAAAGKGVCNGSIINMNIRDIAAVILYAFDLPMPDFRLDGWTSQLPEGLFEDIRSGYRDITAETGAEMRISRKQHTSQKN